MNTYDPISPFDCISLVIDDALLSKAKIAAYMYDQEFENSEGKEKPFTPKAFPGKAIAIVIPLDDLMIDIYLDSDACKWDSKFVCNGRFGKLSPDQMEQFFRSEFYNKMIQSLSKKWPTSDPNYAKLFNAVLRRELRIGEIPEEELEEADKLQNSLTEIEHKHKVNQPNKRVDLANKDTTGDGERDYSGSGRKIIHNFGDSGVKGNSGMYFCWPRPGKEFKWNSWKDWTKIKPFCKMTFIYNGRQYMISSSLFDEEFDNRGFRGADEDWEPPFAWLTPGECESIMKLSIVRKFLRQCKRRIKPYLDMKPEEVMEKIDKKDRVTLKEIEKTQRVIRNAAKVLFGKGQQDNYKYDR